MNICGESQCSASQMAQYLIAKNPTAAPWALDYARLYLEEGAAEGVRGDGAWIQSCKETGNFRFTGGTAVTFDQNNFCGLGVTKKGVKGHSFDTPRLGIRAQIQHLKGYASPLPLKNACVDPRYGYIHPRGKAPRFQDLAGKWAVPGYDTSRASSLQDAMEKKIGYGFDIIAGVEEMKKLDVSGNPQTEAQNPLSLQLILPLKIRWANRSNYGGSRSLGAIRYLVIHYTGNDGDSDEANGSYFANNAVKTSAHYFVDDDSVTQTVPDNYTAYHCGAKKYYHPSCRNANSIGIELCDTRKNGIYDVTEKTLANALTLASALMKKYQIPLEHVLRHYDVTHKNCPAYFVSHEADWQAFKNRLAQASANPAASGSLPSSGGTDSSPSHTGSSPSDTGSPGDTGSSPSHMDSAPSNISSSLGDTGSSPTALMAEGLNHGKNFTGVDDSANISRAKARILQRALNLDYGRTLAEDGIIGPKSRQKLGTHYVKQGEKQYLVTAAEILLYLSNLNPRGVELPGIYGSGLTAAAKLRFGGNGQKITASDFLALVQ